MGKSGLTGYLHSIMQKKDWSAAGRFFTRKNSRLRDGEGRNYKVYELSLKDYLREGSAGLALSAVTAYTFYRSAAMFLFLVPLALIGFPRLRREHLKNKRLWELTLEFKEAIWIVSGFLSAGISVENAFEMAVPELVRLYGEDAMIVEEFQRITRGLKLNKPIEPMLQDFAERSGLQDIRNFTEVFSIAKRSGGSLKEIIERTGKIIRDKTAVTEEIRSMTASRRYEQNIMNILPFGIILYINLTSNGFLNVMYERFAGRMIMTACLALIALSYWLSQKILDIRV